MSIGVIGSVGETVSIQLHQKARVSMPELTYNCHDIDIYRAERL